jgi:hypothetical protein
MIIIIKQFHLLTIVDNEGLVKGLQTMTGVGGGYLPNFMKAIYFTVEHSV